MTDVEQFVIAWVARRSGSPITANDDLFEVGGLDSLDFVELLEDVEAGTGLSIDALSIADWSVVRTARGLSMLSTQETP